MSDLSATGFVSVYNANGSVDVLADVVGYYVDHNHDDRYVRLPEHELVVNPATFVEVDPADAWAYAGLWSHNPGVPTNECLYAPLENVPVGRQLGPVRVSYRSTAGSNVQASVIGLRSTPGATAGSIQTLVSPAVSLLPPPAGRLARSSST